MSIFLASPEETAALAARLGEAILPGDCLLLYGQIGGGKTHFARHLIQSQLEVPEDVPSPTYTLVQVYQTRRGEIWHADLYRLNSVDELEELGLSEAMAEEITLIEWPEKLGDIRDKTDALSLNFSTDAENENARHLSLSWKNDKWAERVKALR